MEVEVYIDVIFFINFIMDFAVLKIVSLLFKSKTSLWRQLLAAAFGGLLISFLYMFPWRLHIWSSLFAYMAICGSMAYIAFPTKNFFKWLKSIAMVYMVTVFLGGTMNWLYYATDFGRYFQYLTGESKILSLSKKAFVILAVISIILVRILLGGFNKNKRESKQIYQIGLWFSDKKIEGTGLMDTGNFLTDPLTKKPVVIGEASFVKKALTKEYAECADMYFKQGILDYNYIYEKELFRVKEIPYSSIGVEQGKMLAFVFDELDIKVGKNKIVNRQILVALSPKAITKNNKYDLILHPDVI